MRSIASLVNNLSAALPAIHFVSGSDFHWSAHDKTVYYDATSTDQASLLHEVAHACLAHTSYANDIELIKMERDAWEYARTTLGPSYKVAIDDELIQEALDTYRDWLHSRSICPHCQATGVQAKKSSYQCLACGQHWRVNDARFCALRRYPLSKK